RGNCAGRGLSAGPDRPLLRPARVSPAQRTNGTQARTSREKRYGLSLGLKTAHSILPAMEFSGMHPTSGGTMAAPHLLERAEQWLTRRWVPAAINIAALALLCYTLAQGTWRLLTPAAAESPPPAVPVSAAAPDLQVLLDAELFGRAAAAAARDPALSLDAIPPSSLNLTLTGVMVTAGGSFALISAGGGPELPFAVGHEVAPGASLYAVYPDRVLI